MGEYNKCIQATTDEIRKVQNTLEKFDIVPSEIERWKNNNWQNMEQLVSEHKRKELAS